MRSLFGLLLCFRIPFNYSKMVSYLFGSVIDVMQGAVDVDVSDLFDLKYSYDFIECVF